MSKDKENRDDQLKTGKPVRVRGFPRAGIAHSVIKLPSYVKMTVTKEEQKVVIAYRKQKSAELQRAKEFMQARKTAIDAYNNYKA